MSERMSKSSQRPACSRFILESQDHATADPIARTRSENVQALLIGTPLQDVDIDVANAPFAHGEAISFVEVDCVRPDQGGAVIVDLENFFSIYDTEFRPEREMRPIGGGTLHIFS